MIWKPSELEEETFYLRILSNIKRGFAVVKLISGGMQKFAITDKKTEK